MASSFKAKIDAIFGHKSYLRPGEDDEKLLQCLELSDLSDCGDTSDDDCEDFIEQDEHDMDHPELDRDVQELIFEHDSDDEPLSELRKKLLQQKSLGDGKHLSWTKMGCFVPPDVNLAEPEDTAYERRDWKIEDYIRMYFDDSDFVDICHCTNVKFLHEKGRPMNLTAEEIRPLIDRIRKGCTSVPRNQEVAIDEQMIPFSGMCHMKQFVRGKPNPVGLKNFVCATSEGLVLDFVIYQGKNTFPDHAVTNLGVGPSAVIIMPFDKGQKKYGRWSEADMEMALKAYKTKRFGLNETCKKYGVPKATLKRHLESKNKVANESRKRFGRTTVFSEELEETLAEHILNLEKMFFGVTIKDVRKAAFDLAEINNIKHNFNRVKKQAGKKWFYGFMRRHPSLSLRQPESTSMARCRGFNRENVKHFFDLLEKIIDKNKFDATRIFNVDESGFSTVAKKCQKNLAQKGKRQVGTIASGERGVNTTMVVSCSAAGRFVAPMLIFKRKRANPDLAVGAPPDCLVEISDTGYINKTIFLRWLQTFIEAVKPSVDNKVLLVLDGHTTHSKNIEAIELARNNGVIMLQLPGHTTNRLQPLDVAVFRPLELYYTEANEKWLRSHPGLTVSQYQVAQLLGEAYGRAAVIANAMNGFRRTGIWPVDRNVFSDADFIPADVLSQNHNMNSNTDLENQSTSDSDDEPLIHYFQKDATLSKATQEELVIRDLNVASTSKEAHMRIIETVLRSPTVDQTKVKKTKGAQKAEVITSTPYKDELQGKQPPDNMRSVKRKVQFDSNTSNKKSINEKEWYCKLCNECSIEDMIQCLQCRTWVHEICANVQSREKFICDFCI
nr:unnamed protein product [Callosobruchus chinensis]